MANVSNGVASIVSNNLTYTGKNRDIYLSASGSAPSYSTNLIYFRTGTGVSSYTVSYANSSSTGNTASVTGRNSSTSIYVRASTNAQVTHINYESGYGGPLQFVEYTDSTFSTVKEYFDQGDLYVYSSGTRYVKLFATRNQLKCYYYANGGTFSGGSNLYTDSVDAGEYSYTSAPSNAVSRSGYELVGWATDSSATTAGWGTNDSIGPLSGNISVYAVWRKSRFTITVNANGGIFQDTRESYVQSKADAGSLFYFTSYSGRVYREGYTLLGWSVSSTATSPGIATNGYITVGYSDATYYAVWQKSTAVITFYGNGGLWGGNLQKRSVTFNVGDAVNFATYSANLARAGYTLLGWSTSSSATSAAWEPSGTVAVGSTNADYYAVWAKKNIELFYWDSATTDSTLIAKGQPISNMTASRWNRFKAKIAELAAEEGGSYSYSTVASGDTFYATEFNAVRTAIMNRSGYGTLPAAQASGNAVKASLFEGSGSLKTALNAAITHYNNS